jgi:deoxyribodipyrimidine photo-lyase
MYALHIFRPRLYAELPKYLVPQPVIKPHREWKPWSTMESFPLREDVTHGW